MNTYDKVKAQIDYIATEAPYRFLSCRYRGKGRPRKSDYTEGVGGMQGLIDAKMFEVFNAGFTANYLDREA